MDLFFVQDYREKYRYFSSESLSEIQGEFSRLRKFLEMAKIKLLKLLPLKTLKQEQAFGLTMKITENQVRIYHSGRLDKKRIERKFYFFIQRQRSKHIIVLVGESIILPISGIAAVLPGPNIFFYVLALLVIIQWRALRGINRLTKKDPVFIPAPSLKEWETAVHNHNESSFFPLLEKIGDKHNIQDINKILWK